MADFRPGLKETLNVVNNARVHNGVEYAQLPFPKRNTGILWVYLKPGCLTASLVWHHLPPCWPLPWSESSRMSMRCSTLWILYGLCFPPLLSTSCTMFKFVGFGSGHGSLWGSHIPTLHHQECQKSFFLNSLLPKNSRSEYKIPFQWMRG
jgi:hypothetical protein